MLWLALRQQVITFDKETAVDLYAVLPGVRLQKSYLPYYIITCVLMRLLASRQQIIRFDKQTTAIVLYTVLTRRKAAKKLFTPITLLPVPYQVRHLTDLIGSWYIEGSRKMIMNGVIVYSWNIWKCFALHWSLKTILLLGLLLIKNRYVCHS